MTLALSPRGATRLIAANDFALSKGRSEFDLDALPPDDSRYLLKWDLDRGLCERAPCPDGTRFVFVQVLNDRGYASEVVSTSVELDRTAPDIAVCGGQTLRLRSSAKARLTVSSSS